MTRPCRVSECKGTDESWMGLCQAHYNQLPYSLRQALQNCQWAGERDRGRAISAALDWLEVQATQGNLFGE